MAHRAQLTTVSAESGAGKTYLRCARFLVDEFLPHEEGVSYSNFPIDLESIIKHFEGKIDRQEIERRIQIIPDDVLLEWRDGISGPWDYFANVEDMQQAHIQLDEAHVYIHKKDLQKWQNWLGVLRHDCHATCEFISQNMKKIPIELRDEAGSKIVLIDSQSMRDPLLKIPFSDWYELRAMLTGKYTVYFIEQESKRHGEVWKQEAWRWHIRNPYYFQFYDSYNVVAGIGKGGEAQKQEYEKRTVPGLVFWFVRRNFISLGFRGGIGLAAAWSVIFGIPLLFSAINSTAVSKVKDKKKEHPKVIYSEYMPDKDGQIKMLQMEVEELKTFNRQLMYDATVADSMYDKLIDKILKVQQENDRIGMVFPDKAVTVGGRVVKKGDKVKTVQGEKEIKGIDYDESKIQFTDDTGEWVTIGQRRVQAAYENELISADVQANAGTRQRSSARAGFTTTVKEGPRNIPGGRSTTPVSGNGFGKGVRRDNNSGTESNR